MYGNPQILLPKLAFDDPQYDNVARFNRNRAENVYCPLRPGVKVPISDSDGIWSEHSYHSSLEIKAPEWCKPRLNAETPGYDDDPLFSPRIEFVGDRWILQYFWLRRISHRIVLTLPANPQCSFALTFAYRRSEVNYVGLPKPMAKNAANWISKHSQVIDSLPNLNNLVHFTKFKRHLNSSSVVAVHT